MGWLVEAGIYAAALALLLLRTRWTAGQAEAVSLLLVGTTLAAQVHGDWNGALSGVRFAAFGGFKLLALMVATLMPFRPALAYAVVGACAVLPVALYGAMPAPLRAALPVEEPWHTVIYPLIGAGILVYRARTLRIEQELTRALAEREQLERFAKLSLAYRDLVNSPVQAIVLVSAELRARHPESRKLLDLLQGSVARLRAMGEMLSQTEHQVRWTSKEEAFDAAQVIVETQRGARG